MAREDFAQAEAREQPLLSVLIDFLLSFLTEVDFTKSWLQAEYSN